MGDPFSTETFQRYFDESSGNPLSLCFDKHEVAIDGVDVFLDGVPLLKDEDTGKIYYPDKTKALIKYFVSEAVREGRGGLNLSPKGTRDVRYPFAEKFDFLYSYIDYEYIPGLVRPWDEGFLTPVFFNLAVLNKYSQHPEYELNLFSETYGDIRKQGEWYIAFGINRDKKVLMWLGDIDKLPDAEKYYLRSENIPSDHDIHSEFYDAQIEVQFSELSPQSKAFHKRSELQELVSKRFGYDVYSFEGEVSNLLEHVDRPVFWEDKHVAPFVNALNQVFVESINNSAIKGAIDALSAGQDTKGKKGLKLLEMWCESIAQVDSPREIMAPFFILYDFRIIFSHLQSDESKAEMRQSICGRLAIDSSSDNEAIYDSLIAKVVESYEAIIDTISR